MVVKSDGSIWFTDPSYGIMTDYEGDKAVPDMDGCHVYRIVADGSAITRMTSDFDKPNGLAFSPDERQLYIVDSGSSRHIRHFNVAADGSLSGGEVFAASAGLDGFRFDRDRRIWTSAAGGVNCYHPDGTLIGRIRIPEIVSNVTFGGPKRNRLFICGTTSIYSTFLTVTGVTRG